MLKFVSAYLALGYLAFATIVILGLFQALAAWVPLRGLALVDYRRPGLIAMGPVLAAVGYLWFFGTRREILTPGPAGAELMVLFIGATLGALLLTLAGASVVHPYRVRVDMSGLQVSHGRLASGATYECLRRSGASGQRPGVLVLPDPALIPVARALAAHLASAGYVALLPAWPRAAQESPLAQALAGASLEALAKEPDVDAADVSIVGHGLGADLALVYGAATRCPVRAVAAIAPLREAPWRPGLGLVREMTYAEACAWQLGGRRASLLRSWASAPAVPPTQVIVLLGAEDSIVPPSSAEAQDYARYRRRTIAGATHISLASGNQGAETVVEWLAAARSSAMQPVDAEETST